jgi:hypothetical protein
VVDAGATGAIGLVDDGADVSAVAVPATAPKAIMARTIHSTGLGETFTSAPMHGVSAA